MSNQTRDHQQHEMEIEPTEHPLALDQRNGISIQRRHQLAHQLLQA